MRKAGYSENLIHIFLLFSILAIIIAAYDIILNINKKVSSILIELTFSPYNNYFNISSKAL